MSLGIPNVDDMLSGIPAAMFAEWLAFDQLEPITTAGRFEWMLAKLEALLANIYRDPKKHIRAFKPDDFLPNYGPPEKKKPGDLYGEFRTWAILMGAKKQKQVN